MSYLIFDTPWRCECTHNQDRTRFFFLASFAASKIGITLPALETSVPWWFWSHLATISTYLYWGYGTYCSFSLFLIFTESECANHLSRSRKVQPAGCDIVVVIRCLQGPSKAHVFVRAIFFLKRVSSSKFLGSQNWVNEWHKNKTNQNSFSFRPPWIPHPPHNWPKSV